MPNRTLKMAAKWLVGCGLVLGSLYVAPTHAEEVSVWPDLRVGLIQHIEMTKTRERQRGDQPATTRSATTPVRIEVLEVGMDEIVIGWTTGKTKIQPELINEQNSEFVDPLLKLTENQRVELVFDRDFTARSIRNLNQIIETTQRGIDIMELSIPDDGAVAEVVPRLRELFNDRDAVQTFAIQQPGRYFLPYGWTLEPGVPREQDVTLPNPLGGDPFPAKLTTEIKQFLPSDKQLRFVYQQKLDQQAVQRIILETMARLTGKQELDFEQIPRFDVQDSADFSINRETGWVEHAIVKRITTAQGDAQVETFEFRAVPQSAE